MVTSSKILTVTYGTFSCRLEGFDDPFTTLQKVAEYFRSLAAKDRQFGGVQQMPDTEVLMQIANQANPSGVDAEVDAGGIILRQKSAGESSPVPETETLTLTVPAPEAAPDVTEAAPEDVSDESCTANAIDRISTLFRSRRHAPAETGESETEVADVAEDDDAVAEASAEPEPARRPPLKQSVAETLAAIRRNVEQAGSGMTISEALDDDKSYEEEDGEDEAQPETAEDPTETSAGIEDDDTLDPTLAEIAGELSDGAEIDVSEDPSETLTHDSVGIAEEEIAVEDVVTDAEVAEDKAVAELEAETEDAESNDDAAAEDESEAESVWVEDEPAIEAETDAGLAFDESEQFAAAESDVNEDDVADEDRAAVAPASDDATLAEGEAETEDAAFDDEFFRPAAKEPALLAAVAKSPANSSLTQAQEEELARDLEAAMEARTEEDPVDTAADLRRRERRARAEALRDTNALQHDDLALDRLLEATQHKMNRPEQRRRIDALDQLKAAVAATEADAQMRDGKPDADDFAATDLAAYRDDLRQAQQRGRSIERAGSPARSPSGGDRPAQAPLILVSEQRIDDPLDNIFAAEPEEPRREVAETSGNLALKRETALSQDEGDNRDDIQGILADAFSEATTFADFAERIGATEMHDLLEAAAAYTAIIENNPRFSRAQVMSKIARIDTGEGFSKEAGLRAFGKLLREGKILQVQDGQFEISKASRFSIALRQE